MYTCVSCYPVMEVHCVSLKIYLIIMMDIIKKIFATKILLVTEFPTFDFCGRFPNLFLNW